MIIFELGMRSINFKSVISHIFKDIGMGQGVICHKERSKKAQTYALLDTGLRPADSQMTRAN
jgi:hypothetical protein